LSFKDVVHAGGRTVLLPVTDTALARAFAGLAWARGGRPLHPRGVVHAAVLEVEPGSPLGVPLLDTPGRHRAVVRVSRAAGLPPWLPDVHGVAVRLLDVHGPGRHQDVLLNTSSARPLLRHVPIPSRELAGRFLSALAPTALAGVPFVLGAVPLPVTPGPTPRQQPAGPDGAGPAWRLVVARGSGAWRPLGVLRLGERTGEGAGDGTGDDGGLEFDVHVNTGGGISPTGAVQALRHSSYRAAQRVRRERSARPVPTGR
jgi:hypothetical protein